MCTFTSSIVALPQLYVSVSSVSPTLFFSSIFTEMYSFAFIIQVIQDICFSHYSQWIAIVSSRGTCHIFVLSPFGGENVLQIHNSHVDGPALLPVVSLPWWSTPSFLLNQLSFSSSPPSPVTLSVVSRIKNNNSGWLNTVSHAASSGSGKASIPSGAIAAVFHSCVPQDSQPAHLRKVNSLDHLMVYTPCGHVVQYKLFSSVGGEPSDIASRNGPASSVQMQDEELRVNVESVQWWDVCRRADWPEREECISGITRRGQETKETVMYMSDGEDDGIGHSQLVKSHEPSHLYLSNAEVQMSSWRIPLWQKSKVFFRKSLCSASAYHVSTLLIFCSLCHRCISMQWVIWGLMKRTSLKIKLVKRLNWRRFLFMRLRLGGGTYCLFLTIFTGPLNGVNGNSQVFQHCRYGNWVIIVSEVTFVHFFHIQVFCSFYFKSALHPTCF